MLKLLQTLLALIQAWFSSKQQSELIKAGEDKVLSKQAQKEIDVVIKADEARKEAAASAAAVPITDSLPNDGFRRD